MRNLLRMAGMAAPIALAASAASAEGVLNFANWAEYTSPELIEKFEKETGIKVVLDTYDSSETLLAKLQAGGADYDVVVPGNNFVAGMISEGLIQNVDVRSLPGFANLEGRWQSPPWDPTNEYSIPWLWGTTGFTVDTSAYGGDIHTYEVLFNPPPELQGEIGMFNSADEVVKMVHAYLGNDLCTEDPAHFQAAFDVLKAQKQHVKMYQSEGLRERMLSGEVKAHSNWNGSSLKLRAQDAKFAYAYPKEGVLTWMDVMVVPSGAKNKDNALKFLAFMLQPENVAIQSNFARYSNAVAGSDAYMAAELKTAPEIVAPSDRTFIFVPACSEKSIKLQDQVWTRLLK
ncbi:extracellular solute-binding protein [Pelagibius sp.]|uniref:ABC transporter substrate-binding protein n=1 Tax=Pelagibius sp. TaxID=1931238 RepID=UPI003BB202A4